MLADRTLAFAEQAPAIQTRKALGTALMEVAGGLGATYFACLYVRRDAQGQTIERSISNVPRQWQELYLERGYEATDPVFQNVMRGGAYGFWSEMTSGLVLGRSGREVMGAARQFDMRDGFTRRVMLDSGGAAVMMVAGPELVRHPRARAALRMTFDVFANEGARLLKRLAPEDARPAPELSATQLKVLLMRAQGLSNREVAAALGRHEKTVETHVTGILRRLEARNMIEAIRIAGQRKLIV